MYRDVYMDTYVNKYRLHLCLFRPVSHPVSVLHRADSPARATLEFSPRPRCDSNGKIEQSIGKWWENGRKMMGY